MCYAWERESLKERNHLEDRNIDGIRMDIWEICWGGVDWIPLAQDRDQWWAVVNAVLNLRVRAPQS
jgi:hypothetical protein